MRRFDTSLTSRSTVRLNKFCVEPQAHVFCKSLVSPYLRHESPSTVA